MQSPGTIVVDMRNHYESEVGRFKDAICPDADTFRQELPMVLDLLKEKKENKILLYCTGGIRCEKASAFLKSNGFEDVNQLDGGIIHYARQVKAEGLDPISSERTSYSTRIGKESQMKLSAPVTNAICHAADIKLQQR